MEREDLGYLGTVGVTQRERKEFAKLHRVASRSAYLFSDPKSRGLGVAGGTARVAVVAPSRKRGLAERGATCASLADGFSMHLSR